MKSLRKTLRLILTILLLLLAAAGVGLTGNFLSPNRERYMDTQIVTEQVDKKDEEEEKSEEEEIKS